MNTDTPETDGEWNRLACQDGPEFERNMADFARKLERERDKARKWSSTLADAGDEIRAQLREEQQLHTQTLNERDEARDQRDRLAESLNRACANPTTGNWYREAESEMPVDAATPCSALDAALALVDFGPCRGAERPQYWINVAGPMCAHCEGVEDVNLAAARIIAAEYRKALSVIETIEQRYSDGENTHDDWRFMGSAARDYFLTPNAGGMARDLATMTDQRDAAMQCHEWCREDRKHIIKELIKVTEQRDRLAEALNKACANPTTGNWYREAEDAITAWKEARGES